MSVMNEVVCHQKTQLALSDKQRYNAQNYISIKIQDLS